MPAFDFQAVDSRGKTRKGVLEGDSERHIRQQLREQGLLPVQVHEVAAERKRKRGGQHRQGGLSNNELALLTRQFATLIGAGLPVEEALESVAQQSSKARSRSLLTALRSRILEGHSLAQAMDEFPTAFFDLYRATVRAGEQAGHLEVVLERLADYTENRQVMQQKLMLALVYPAILTVVAIGVVVILLTAVVPQVVQVYSHMHQTLPWNTRLLIHISDLLQQHGVALLFVFSASGVLLHLWFRRPGPKAWLHRTLLRLPLIGSLTRGLNTARFARTFSILLASGVPALEAMSIGAEVLGNLTMRASVTRAAKRVREGSSLHQALNHDKLFPPVTLHLIANGEASGRLEQMLDKAADNQERDLSTRIATLMALFEPLMLLAMGGIVLFIVLAILLPIFNMNQLVG